MFTVFHNTEIIFCKFNEDCKLLVDRKEIVRYSSIIKGGKQISETAKHTIYQLQHRPKNKKILIQDQ
jgi:hypothetical protein